MLLWIKVTLSDSGEMTIFKTNVEVIPDNDPNVAYCKITPAGYKVYYLGKEYDCFNYSVFQLDVKRHLPKALGEILTYEAGFLTKSWGYVL